MAKITELSAEKLRTSIAPERIPYNDSTEIPKKYSYALFQPRATQALEMALKIPSNEYNVFIAGEPNMGRRYFVMDYLSPVAKKSPTPPDWVYLHNFDDPDKPLAISLPSGSGHKFKTAQSKTMTALKNAMHTRIEQEDYQKKLRHLTKITSNKKEALLAEMERVATSKEFDMELSNRGSISLSPIIDGKPITDEQYDQLSSTHKRQFKQLGDILLSELNSPLLQLSKLDTKFQTDEQELQRRTAQDVVTAQLKKIRTTFASSDKLMEWFVSLEEDIIENIEFFVPSTEQASPQEVQAAEDFLTRYEVNLFVDNKDIKGAPVVYEDHPTYFNLLGCIERESELGATYTDFTLIRSGSLHRANNGFLIINIDDLLDQTQPWEGLLRSLRCGNARIEDPVEPDQIKTKTIVPEPIPLSLRIILIGSDEAYETLLYHDDRFQKHFKLKGHLQTTAQLNATSIKRFLSVVGRIIDTEKMLPFDREALAALTELSCKLAEDQKMLSLIFPALRERMIEGDAIARKEQLPMVTAKCIADSLELQMFRSNLYEEEFMADYDREVIKVSTKGQAIGHVNGLSVTLYGDFEFGLPHQISCTVGVGHDGIIDLEREAEMGGPIHTKGMMIIKSYLVGLFAKDKPIVLTGSLCIEQSYAGIEGDSASGAELAALISALADVPNRLSLAFTGAVSQSGKIMAVGGVSRKIEGFFEVCRRRGLTGKQGIILPADNILNLQLCDKVTDAVRDGKFHIYPVSTIEQALEILTGIKAGKRNKNGKFPSGTLYRMVDDRLAELAELSEKYKGKVE
ncbi:MAG: Lon protease family protein [Desulfovibrio sp.]